MRINYRWKYLVIIIALITGYFLLFNFSIYLNGHTVCLFKNVTGIPCPACGSTRATNLLFKGKIRDSILINPFGILTNISIVISIFWMISDMARGKETFFSFLKKDWDKRIKIFIYLIILINWIWNIKKGL